MNETVNSKAHKALFSFKFAEFTLALGYQVIKREKQNSPMTFKVFYVCFERAEQKIGYDEYGEYAEIQRML
jgi:hypothetical protein